MTRRAHSMPCAMAWSWLMYMYLASRPQKKTGTSARPAISARS